MRKLVLSLAILLLLLPATWALAEAPAADFTKAGTFSINLVDVFSWNGLGSGKMFDYGDPSPGTYGLNAYSPGSELVALSRPEVLYAVADGVFIGGTMMWFETQPSKNHMFLFGPAFQYMFAAGDQVYVYAGLGLMYGTISDGNDINETYSAEPRIGCVYGLSANLGLTAQLAWNMIENKRHDGRIENGKIVNFRLGVRAFF